VGGKFVHRKGHRFIGVLGNETMLIEVQDVQYHAGH